MVEKEETFQRPVPKKEGKPLSYYLFMIGGVICFLLFVGLLVSGVYVTFFKEPEKINQTVTYRQPDCFVEKEQLSLCLSSLNQMTGILREQKTEPETIIEKPKKMDRDVELCQNSIGRVFYNYDTTECKDGGKQNTPLKCCRTKFEDAICVEDLDTTKDGFTKIKCLR